VAAILCRKRRVRQTPVRLRAPSRDGLTFCGATG